MKLINIDCPNCGCKIHVEPEQRKWGEWIEQLDNAGYPCYQCSKCGEYKLTTYNYCPDCGAYMGDNNYEFKILLQ